jgi:hypothetical protein
LQEEDVRWLAKHPEYSQANESGNPELSEAILEAMIDQLEKSNPVFNADYPRYYFTMIIIFPPKISE